MSLEGRVVLVTGSSRGIGKAIALEAARRGARVGLSFFSSREAGTRALEEVQATGSQAWIGRLDLNRPETVSRWLDGAVEHFGRLDVLVASAALGRLGRVVELDLEGWIRTMEVNVGSLIAMVQRARTSMTEGGRVLVITSLGSVRVLPGYGAMGAAKAALESVVRALAVELAGDGIGVNALCPGLTDTQSLRFFPARETMIAITTQRTPAGRLGTPEDVARIAAWLMGPDSSWIVGQTIVADGGYALIG